MSTALDQAIARELQHPSGTMDDPLTAALGQCQCCDDFWATRDDAVTPAPLAPPARAAGQPGPRWTTAARLCALAVAALLACVLLPGCGGGDWTDEELQDAAAPTDVPPPALPSCSTRPELCA